MKDALRSLGEDRVSVTPVYSACGMKREEKQHVIYLSTYLSAISLKPVLNHFSSFSTSSAFSHL